MTENLVKKVEEKIMLLITELENVRKELQYTCHELDRAQEENSQLKIEKNNYMDKLRGVVSLLEAVDIVEPHSNYQDPAVAANERVEHAASF